MNDKWLKQYKENYEGKSAEANSVAEYLKENYKGNAYIPWATMERLTYMQDPNAKFEKIRNDKGGLVHTDSFVNENLVENKDGIVSKTSAAVVSHFVKVSLVFLGKEFIEEFPIQEQDYSPAKIYNQNLVNKALQRALAKVASRATGIGLKLYENKDLQFEEDKEKTKPVVKKSVKKEIKEDAPVQVENTQDAKVEETASKVVNTDNSNITTSAPIVEIQPTKYTKEVVELCTFIKSADKEKMIRVLQNVNVPILKQHNFTLNIEDSDNDLCEKLSHFPNIQTFTKAIKTMLDSITG